MSLTEMEQALAEAKAHLSRADMLATSLARMLIGRLRRVDSAWVLKDLKRELRDYNMHTGTWRKE